MAEDELFLVTQKAVIEKDGKVLVLIHPKYGLDLPGGKILICEESFSDSFKREVMEKRI